MSVRLKSLKIKNFRSCKSTELFMNNFTSLIGYNNAGKSTIILAIKFLLEGTIKNFNFSTNANLSNEPIEVEALFTNIEEPCLKLLEESHAEKIRPFVIDKNLLVKRTTYIESGKQKIKLSLFNGTVWKDNPTGIDNAITRIFPNLIHIEAMTDAVEDSTKSKTTTTIGKLLSLISEEIQNDHREVFSSSLSEVEKLLSYNGENRIEALLTVDQGINSILQDFFPEISVKLHFPTPSIDEIFKTGTLKIFEQQTNERDFSNFGHGTQRSIQMTLIRYLADLKQQRIESQRSNTLICIDEPELYLHPTTIELVREALIKLSKAGYQIIFSTHSASLLTAEQATNAIQIYKTSGEGTLARKPISEIILTLQEKYQGQFREIFELNNASKIFFCEEVLLVE